MFTDAERVEADTLGQYGFFDDGDTESFGLSADGTKATLAVSRTTRSLMLADRLPQENR